MSWRLFAATPPIVHLNDLPGVLTGRKRMSIHLYRARSDTKHHDAALMPLFTGNGELEAVYPCKAALAAGVPDQPEATKGNVAVKQFYIHLLAVLPHSR